MKWEEQWRQYGTNRREATWRETWTKQPRRLYDGCTKAQATALFLMRTEVIGLNKWLTTRHVPGVGKECGCGWHEQTVQHVVLHCPRYNRETLLPRLRSERLAHILEDPTQARTTAEWFIQQNILRQFLVAREIESTDRGKY
jgi:hypothetical protein